MSEVQLQRLEIETKFGHAGAVMVNDDSGDYYRADDVDEAITTLQRERDELKKQRDELQAIVDKGVAVAKLMDESTGLNGIHLNGAEYDWCEDDDAIEFRRLIQPHMEAALEAKASSEAASKKGGEESKHKPCDKCGKLTLRDTLRCIYRSPFSPVYCPSCYEGLYK